MVNIKEDNLSVPEEADRNSQNTMTVIGASIVVTDSGPESGIGTGRQFRTQPLHENTFL